MNYDFDIRVFSSRPEKAINVVNALLPLPVKIFDGTGYEGFSKLINHSILDCNSEIVILIADKVIPKKDEIDKIINLLNDGYAFVAPHMFAFFGFKKQLIREVGFLDERFRGGEYSDSDFIKRIKLHNVAIYMTDETCRSKEPSTWHSGNVGEHYRAKWREVTECDYKLLPEETYNYNLGEEKKCNWKTWRESILEYSGPWNNWGQNRDFLALEKFKNKQIFDKTK
jgi:hypothetical protein